MMKKVLAIIGGITVVMSLIFGIWKFEDRYATAGEVAEQINRLQQEDTKQAVEIQGIKDGIKLDNVQKRIWNLDDRYGIGCQTCPQEVMQEYRELVLEKERLTE